MKFSDKHQLFSFLGFKVTGRETRLLSSAGVPPALGEAGEGPTARGFYFTSENRNLTRGGSSDFFYVAING